MHFFLIFCNSKVQMLIFLNLGVYIKISDEERKNVLFE